MMYTYLNMFTVYTWLIVFFFLCVCVFKGGGEGRLGIFPMEGQGGGSCQSNAAKFSSLC